MNTRVIKHTSDTIFINAFVKVDNVIYYIPINDLYTIQVHKFNKPD